MKNGRDKKASIIAAAITFFLALLILLLLFTLSLKYDREALADASTPEIQEEEEVYLEPEILQIEEPGDVLNQEEQESAPQPPGEPDPGEEEQPERIVHNTVKNPEPPVSNKPQLVSSKEQSDVKTSPPKIDTRDEKRITSMSGRFSSDNNGSNSGKESGMSGTGGAGVSQSGSVNGRRMLSCPTSVVTLNQTTTIRVNITVNAAGRVISAKAASGGTPELRAKCEAWARGSRWTEAPGAPDATGSITFTITPK